jgi:hypothetical protein
MGVTMSWFMLTWVFLLLGFMSIGGYFMFRKFLKVLPKQDGKSKLDWQNHWVESSRPLWNEQTITFLHRLVAPVPSAFRDIARHTIAARIGQLAIERNAPHITRELCLEGYILATPRRDHRFLKKFLKQEGIDIESFRSLLQ